MVAVSPKNTWYHQVQPTDAARIVSEHFVGGHPVEALRYVAPPGYNKLPE